MRRNWTRYLLILALIGVALFGYHNRAQAEERVSALVYKDFETRRALIIPKIFHESFSLSSFQSAGEVTFSDVWCRHLTLNYWSNSRHPGYKNPPNQHQDGIGWKCRKMGNHPTFVSVDAMENSWKRPTIALSLGQQIDLLDWHGVKYYVGASFTALTYEMPTRNRAFFGVVPIMHRGVTVDLSQLLSIQFPRRFKGTVGWEELRLPKDDIRVRAWNAGMRMDF